MADETIHVYVEGAKQGAFKGDSADGAIRCTYYGYKLEVPYDPRAGFMMLGKRQHNVVAIRKPLNAVSLQFAQALVGNEVLKSVTLKFYRGGDDYYAVILSNARVMTIEHRVPDLPAGEVHTAAPVEEITFLFQRIEWAAKDSPTTVGDDWTV
jgi:type VI secretion system Hcp family effector